MKKITYITFILFSLLALTACDPVNTSSRASLGKPDAPSLIGEFAFGTNPKLKHFSNDILLDEKIGGTIHIALGRAYPEAGGTNKSAIHWDIIKDMRQEGQVFLDDKLIFESAENFDYPTFRDTITASIHISFISSINGEKVLYIKHPGVFYVPKCYLITDPFENNVAFSVWHPSKDNIIPDKEWTFDLIRLVGGTVGAQYVVEYSARAYQVNYKRTDELDVLLKNITNVFNN